MIIPYFMSPLFTNYTCAIQVYQSERADDNEYRVCVLFYFMKYPFAVSCSKCGYDVYIQG